MPHKNRIIERKALRVDQKHGRVIYLLSLSGEELIRLSGVSRVSRDDELQNLHKHLAILSNFLIRAYIDSRSEPRSSA